MVPRAPLLQRRRRSEPGEATMPSFSTFVINQWQSWDSFGAPAWTGGTRFWEVIDNTQLYDIEPDYPRIHRSRGPHSCSPAAPTDGCSSLKS